MPRTIQNYAIDFNNNKTIELKKTRRLFCICCELLKKDWMEKKSTMFFKVSLKKDVPLKYLNSSARAIKNKKKVSILKNILINFENLNIQ